MAMEPINTQSYTDIQSLAALKTQARQQDPAALRETARQFETLFTKMMLQSMRDARLGEDIFGSSAGQMYESMFDDQIALEMSRGKGIGIADMLIEQLQRAGTQVASTAPLAGLSVAPTGATAISATDAPAAEPGTRRAFLEAIQPAAERAAEALGVSPRALMAQAALETGWGRSIPRNADGSSSYNLFGIKAMGRWQGPSTTQMTTEFVNGQPQRQQDSFRAYGSIEDSFADHSRLLQRSGRYAAARGTGDDVAAYASALQRGGYATDPEYANKLTSVATAIDRVLMGHRS